MHGENSPQTQEALWFSLALMVPDRMFSIALETCRTEDELASIFKVSPAIINIKKRIYSQKQ